jgi:hypothetical protein
MRQISRSPAHVAAVFLGLYCCLGAALADDNYYQHNSQFGVYLPAVPVPPGHDEVRASDGTFCRSSVASGGAYFDMGVMGNTGLDSDFNDSSRAGTVYGRVVMPLGKAPQRLDCSTLYRLEVERLQLELQLLRMGATSGPLAAPKNSNWQSEDWSLQGRSQTTASTTRPVRKKKP